MNEITENVQKLDEVANLNTGLLRFDSFFGVMNKNRFVCNKTYINAKIMASRNLLVLLVR